jgi:tyrosyl-tRNA synthetase
MKDKTDLEKIKSILGRGVHTVVKKESLFKKLESGKPLRIKHGVDPTGPKIHIGRAISFWKLKEFQELGHKIILVIGDFTAQIGDASDKRSMRSPLTEKEVKRNMKNYREQIGKILDIKKTEICYNSEWLGKIKTKELTKLLTNFTIYQMINRRNFKERFETKKPIGLHEILYPIYQGYDSVAVKSDIEIGGFDQLFNLLIGREVQQFYGQKPQDIITFELLYGLDGRKMSTSWGNVINITDSPGEQYGKVMSMKDNLMVNYFKLATKVSLSEIKEIERQLKEKDLSPKNVKARLAREIVSLYHNKKEAFKAEEEFSEIFEKKNLPSEMPEKTVGVKELNILDLLRETGLVPSKSQAQRLIKQGGIKIDGEIQKDWRRKVDIKKGMIVQAGKRKFVKIK